MLEKVPLPPKRLRFMGESDQDFIALGDEFVAALTEHAGLRDDSRVLDIGCGYGRLPHALKRSAFAGSYLGIDVLEKHVRWCNKRLGEPRFRFQHADIKNDRYNPGGSLAVDDLDLGDDRFDVIAAFSVFTHMWPEDVAGVPPARVPRARPRRAPGRDLLRPRPRLARARGRGPGCAEDAVRAGARVPI